jgi:hypothetical protein
MCSQFQQPSAIWIDVNRGKFVNLLWKMASFGHFRWRDYYGRMGSGIVPVIVNWLSWKVTYRISLMLRLIAFEFSYDEFVAIDFDWLGRWRVSWPADLWNQLGVVSATVNLNLVYLLSLFASAIWRCQIRTVSPEVSRPMSGRLASGIRKTLSVTVNLNSINISRHFAYAISASKSVWYLAFRLRVVMRRKVVIHEIPYAIRIWN